MPQKGYIHIEEVKALLGISFGAIYYHKRAGNLPAVLRNNRLEFKKDEVLAYKRKKEGDAGVGERE
jgi:predicted site-specific integrase-resolvase